MKTNMETTQNIDSILLDETENINDDTEDPNMSMASQIRYNELMETISSRFLPTEEQLKKLKDLDIEVAELPFNHHLTKGVSKVDVPSDTLKQEPFSDSEVEMIDRNWISFCEDYGFHHKEDLNIFLPAPFFFKRLLNNKQKRGFAQYLSTGFPDRHPSGVYTKFVSIYGCHRKGHWDREEDELLLSLYDLMPHCKVKLFSICSRILHRKRYLCYRRLKNILNKGTDLVKINPERAIKGHGDEYPDWTLDEKIWNQIAHESSSEKKTLKKAYFLQIHPSLKIKERVLPIDLKRKLLTGLIHMKVTEWDHVDWKYLGHQVFKIGAVKSYSILRKMALKHVPKEDYHRLDVVLKTLEEHYRLNERILL